MMSAAQKYAAPDRERLTPASRAVYLIRALYTAAQQTATNARGSRKGFVLSRRTVSFDGCSARHLEEFRNVRLCSSSGPLLRRAQLIRNRRQTRRRESSARDSRAHGHGFQRKSPSSAAGQRAGKELRTGITRACRAQGQAAVDVERARGYPPHHRRKG